MSDHSWHLRARCDCHASNHNMYGNKCFTTTLQHGTLPTVRKVQTPSIRECYKHTYPQHNTAAAPCAEHSSCAMCCRCPQVQVLLHRGWLHSEQLLDSVPCCTNRWSTHRPAGCCWLRLAQSAAAGPLEHNAPSSCSTPPVGVCCSAVARSAACSQLCCG